MMFVTGNIIYRAEMWGGVIVHQVNNRKVAGAGLAGQLARKYPSWEKEFKYRNLNLGDVMYFTPLENPSVMIASLYAQDGFGTDRTYTDYEKLADAFSRMLEDRKWNDRLSLSKIMIPYVIGCGLGGGSEKVVIPIVEHFVPDAVWVKYE
jgi:O-acetyl-ADP-ribose deacetylase (regulator of RNase III)